MFSCFLRLSITFNRPKASFDMTKFNTLYVSMAILVINTYLQLLKQIGPHEVLTTMKKDIQAYARLVKNEIALTFEWLSGLF